MSAEDFDERVFNEYEKANITLLKEMEDIRAEAETIPGIYRYTYNDYSDGSTVNVNSEDTIEIIYADGITVKGIYHKKDVRYSCEWAEMSEKELNFTKGKEALLGDYMCEYDFFYPVYLAFEKDRLIYIEDGADTICYFIKIQ